MTKLDRIRSRDAHPDPGLPQPFLGQVLREARIKQDLTQGDLARVASVDRTYISQLERGIRQPTVNVLFRLSVPLKLKPSSMVKAAEDMAKSAQLR